MPGDPRFGPGLVLVALALRYSRPAGLGMPRIAGVVVLGPGGRGNRWAAALHSEKTYVKTYVKTWVKTTRENQCENHKRKPK